MNRSAIPNECGFVRQRGLTLIELMVATAISLILLAGVLTIFASSKTTNIMESGLARLQENGRHALYTLVRDIRGAGFAGCAGLGPTRVNIIANNPPDGISNFTEDEVVFGVNDVASGNTWGAKSGSDVIRIRGAGDSLIGLVGNTVPVNANIQTTVAKGYFQAGDILMITDCEGLDIFRATTVSQSGTTSTISHSNSNNTDNFLSKPYDRDAFVMKFRSNTYYVADTGRTNAAGDIIHALYGLDGTDPAATPLELVDGIEDMQILYGIDGDGNGLVDRFLPANSVADWGTVLGVRIALLVNSVDNANTAVVPYQYNGANVTPTDPTDLRLRQEFGSMVTLRNRAG